MRQARWALAVTSAVSLFLAAGCSVKATIDQTTDTTTNVTGTTSSARSWFTEDGRVNPAFKATAFVSLNRDNLARDLAAGQGEYLSSIGSLLGVPDDRQSAFSSAAQARFAAKDGAASYDAHTLLVLLRDTAASVTR